MNIKKKIWIPLVIAAIFLVAGLIFLITQLKDRLELISKAEKNIDLVMSLKDINEDFIAGYNVNSQKTLDVLHYEIKIELLPDAKRIKGNVALTIKVNNPDESEVVLNFYDNLKINYVFIGDKKVKYSRTKTNIAISPKEKLTDTILVKINYEGEPKRLGFGSFNFDEMNGKKLIYTLNEPVFASHGSLVSIYLMIKH